MYLEIGSHLLRRPCAGTRRAVIRPNRPPGFSTLGLPGGTSSGSQRTHKGRRRSRRSRSPSSNSCAARHASSATGRATSRWPVKQLPGCGRAGSPAMRFGVVSRQSVPRSDVGYREEIGLARRTPGQERPCHVQRGSFDHQVYARNRARIQSAPERMDLRYSRFGRASHCRVSNLHFQTCSREISPHADIGFDPRIQEIDFSHTRLPSTSFTPGHDRSFLCRKAARLVSTSLSHHHVPIGVPYSILQGLLLKFLQKRTLGRLLRRVSVVLHCNSHSAPQMSCSDSRESIWDSGNGPPP